MSDPFDSPALLGVRHHGPGSARAVRRALAAYRPQVLLIEGPPEADPLVPLVAEAGMRAPVALLAYPGAPAAAAGLVGGGRGPAGGDGRGRRAVFWPFGEFSPEWQALRWAVAQEVPVHFIDLPAGAHLASAVAGEATSAEPRSGVRGDPIGTLAAAAGYDDPERWWEDVVEHRRSGTDDAMAEVADQAFELHRDERLILDDQHVGGGLAFDLLDRVEHHLVDLGWRGIEDLRRLFGGEVLERGQQQRLAVARSDMGEALLRGLLVRTAAVGVGRHLDVAR